MVSLLEARPGKQHKSARRSQPVPVGVRHPNRTLKLLLPVQGEDKPGLLRLTVNGQSVIYWLRPTDTHIPGRAFILRKWKSTDEYAVLLSADGQHTCSCPAGCWGRSKSCKHRDSLLALTAAGRV
jgi:hypothetical protein